MANNDTPFGMIPRFHRNGAPYNGATTKYAVPAGYATALFVGSVVTKTTTANAAQITTGDGVYGVGTMSEINQTAAGDGNAITGVIVSFDAEPDALETIYSPASTAGVANVADDPDLMFEIQADSAGTIVVTEVGLNAVLIDTHAGNTNTGIAGTELDTTSDPPAADASNQLTIQRAPDREDNDAVAVNGKWLVKINNHTEAHAVVGI